MIFLFLPTSNPRYLLPVIPFLSLLFVLGVFYFKKFDLLVFVILFVLLLSFSLPLAMEIHRSPSPVTQIIDYIEMNYDLNDVFIFGVVMNQGFFKYYDLEFYTSWKTQQATH